jgi:hypothetical protein
MKQILKSKGIIAFFIFILVISILSSNTINAQKNVSAENTNSQIVTQK